MNITEDELSAYADGALHGAAKARVEAAIEADETLRARVKRMRETTQAFRAAFDGVIGEPIPDRHRAIFKTKPASNVFAFPTRLTMQNAWLPLAAAACFGLAFLGGRATAPSSVFVASADGLHAGGALARALDTQASGAGGQARIALSFEDNEGQYCRVFSYAENAGLACGGAGDWRIVALADAPRETHSAYAQAAGALPDSILAEADARRAGDPLDAEGEAKAMKKGWKR